MTGAARILLLIKPRALRLLRIFRVLKLGQYTSEASHLGHALARSRQKITVFLAVVDVTVAQVVADLRDGRQVPHPPGVTLFAQGKDQPGEFVFIAVVDHLGGADPMSSHAHVERTIKTKRESALRPVELLTQATERVTARGLDQRLSADGHTEEFQRLVTVFNQMMDRLERSFHQATRFSADASHELKTPLALLQASTVQGLPSSQSRALMQQPGPMPETWEQTFLAHVSVVHTLPSSHALGWLAAHTPALHVSPTVQTLLSLHGAVLALNCPGIDDCLSMMMWSSAHCQGCR